MMHSLQWTFIVLCFASCNCENIPDCNKVIDKLKNDINQLQKVVRLLAPEDMKDEIEDLLKSTDIDLEEAVKQNTEDIVEIKVDLIHDDFLISENLAITHELYGLLHYLNTTMEQVKIDIEVHNNLVDETIAPIGSIVAWHPGVIGPTKALPEGWQRCDGSIIDFGPMAGSYTPDLNNFGRFLRGARDEEAGEFQEDAIQDHRHLDLGHTHIDNGHSHPDAGHVHYYDESDERGGDWYLRHKHDDPDYHACTNDCSPNSGVNLQRVSQSPIGYSQIEANWADIQPSYTNMEGVDIASYRVADETRVKNMKVVWIMRIF